MFPLALPALHAALIAHLHREIAPELGLQPGVAVRFRALHVATEECDVYIRDGRVPFAQDTVRRTDYPIRVPLSGFTAAGIRECLAKAYPAEAAGLLCVTATGR